MSSNVACQKPLGFASAVPSRRNESRRVWRWLALYVIGIWLSDSTLISLESEVLATLCKLAVVVIPTGVIVGVGFRRCGAQLVALFVGAPMLLYTLPMSLLFTVQLLSLGLS